MCGYFWDKNLLAINLSYWEIAAKGVASISFLS